MALHRNLTGDELHEPKGADTATENTVYVADGLGSGDWTDKYDGHLIRNKYWLTGEIPDVSTASSHARFYIPVDSTLFEIGVITDNPLTTADGTVSIYIGGVLFADTLTLTQSGSVAGSLHYRTIPTANTINAGSVVEIRSDGASDTASIGYVTLGLEAIP